MTAELYNRRILEEAAEACGAGSLEHADRRVTVDNPLCGDRIRLELRLDRGRVSEIAHQTRGCLLTRAAASLLARHAAGLDARKAEEVRQSLLRMLESGSGTPPWPDLEMFRPVTAVRSRWDCVLLPFDALLRGLGTKEGKAAGESHGGDGG